MNAPHKRNGNFQDWNEKMIGGFADWPDPHERYKYSTTKMSAWPHF
jgi:hypothetical protein